MARKPQPEGETVVEPEGDPAQTPTVAPAPVEPLYNLFHTGPDGRRNQIGCNITEAQADACAAAWEQHEPGCEIILEPV